jgi:hypothetical protein
MQEPPRLHIESTFNEFVKEFGGELVSELVPNAQFDNADYFFRAENVVAELKCFEKDLLQERDFITKVNSLWDGWVHKGIVRDVPAGSTFTINTAALPLQCGREIYSLFKKPIEGAIKKASKQIKQTKEYLNVPNAASLLFLANDGNYSLESADIIYIASKILTHQFSTIDGFVYFTVNMRAMKPGYERDVNLWVPEYRGYIEPLVKMVDRMAEAWARFYARKIGQNVPIHAFEYRDRTWLESVKFIKPTKAVGPSAKASKPRR